MSSTAGSRPGATSATTSIEPLTEIALAIPAPAAAHVRATGGQTAWLLLN
jgi:hypothetical protein